MKIIGSLQSLLWVTTLAAVLTACGGGGGGSTTTAASSKMPSSAAQASSEMQLSSEASSAALSSVPISSVAPSSLAVSSSNVSSAVVSSLSVNSSSAGVITSVTIHYKRSAGDYSGWGLHLWGSAIATSTVTTWAAARAFDAVENGWAVAVVPVVNPAVAFNLIAHKGDFKSPTADLSFIPNASGAQVWVVQDNNNLFFNAQDANSAAGLIGNASAALDLAPVAPMTVDSELPQGWNKRANFMEIFVRSYQDSDGDGRGDLQGLISRLDYLKNLGVTGIWLMPIMESSDNDHVGCYFVRNFRLTCHAFESRATDATEAEAHAKNHQSATEADTQCLGDFSKHGSASGAISS